MSRLQHHRRVLVAALLLSPALAHAQVRIEAGSWKYDLTGTVVDNGKTYEFDRDLDLQASGRGSLAIAWDTAPGPWPDWTASYTRFGAHGHHEETAVILLPPFMQNVIIDATANLRDVDIGATWPIHLGAGALSAGFALKRLSGDLTIDDSSNPPPSRETYGQTFPELKLGLRVPLGAAFAIDAATQGVSYGGNRATEWRVGAELKLFQHFLLSAGYQARTYKVDLNSYKLDAHLKGALLSAGWAF
jgi:hypothetical protein